jgi:uncharacterized protein
MAKKRVKKKRGTRKSSRKPDWPVQIVKMMTALVVLALLVLGAGFIAHWFFLRHSPERAGTAVRPDEHFQAPSAPTSRKPAADAAAPVYEVFHRNHPPASRPLAPLPQLPGDRPPVVAIIIDDIGYDRHIADQLMALDVPLTFSFLPYGPFSQSILSQARTRGFEIMLHLPMEPSEYPQVDPGPGALLSNMTPDELIAQLDKDIDRFSGIKGVNNHMGSRLSTSPERMRQIFSILKKRGLYYIDSRTTAETVAAPSARLLQLPFAERDIFIDHVEDAAFIRSQLHRLIKRAQKQGYAIGIAHPHEVTYQVLRDMMPQLKNQVVLVPASMVVRQVTLAQAAKSKVARN